MISEQAAFIPRDWKNFHDFTPVKVLKKRIPIEVIELPHEVIVETLEGNMRGSRGDFLAKGVEGEFYLIRRDIFLKTYEAYTPEDTHELKMSREMFEFLKACANVRRAIDEYGVVYLHDPEAQAVADLYTNLQKIEEKAWEACKNQIADLIGV